MAGLLNVVRRVGGILGVDPQQAPQPQAQPAQGGILVTDANGNTINPAMVAVGQGGPDPAAVSAGLLAANPQPQQATTAPQAMAQASPSIPLAPPPNAALGAIDKLLFGGVFAAAQNDALQRRMAAYQAQQLTAYGNSLPDDQKRAFFADPQGFIKAQEAITQARGSGVKISENSVLFGDPGSGQLVQAGNYGINDSTNKPFNWAPNVTNLGTGVQSGGQFQAGPSIGTGQPTAANGLIVGKPTAQFPNGVVGTYSTSTSQALPGQTITTSPTVTWAPNGGQTPALGYAPPPAAQGAPQTFTFQPPVNGPVTSGFGLRTPPMAGATSNHQGIDIGVPTGTPVAAAAPGVVTFADRKGGYGRTVEITHPDGTVTRYAHLASIGVKIGTNVDGSAQIGASGESGTATGPNLHFQVIRHGQSVDPRSVIGTQGTATQQDAADQGAQPGIRGSVTTTGGNGGSPRYSVVDGAQIAGGKPGERYTVDNLGTEPPKLLDDGRITQSKVAERGQQFMASDDYKQATNAVTAVNGLQRAVASVPRGGALSMATFDTAFRAMNPGIGVRANSVQMALEHMGFSQELQSKFLEAQSKGFVTPDMAKEFLGVARAYAQSHLDVLNGQHQSNVSWARAHSFGESDLGENVPKLDPYPSPAGSARTAAINPQPSRVPDAAPPPAGFVNSRGYQYLGVNPANPGAAENWRKVR